jgi:hypothetical protein
MNATTQALDELCRNHPKFLKRGGLCVALVVTQTAAERGLPLTAENLRTKEEGQVAGLGKAAVQRILQKYGITKVLAEEGGRTSRGSLGLMNAYVSVLNKLHQKGTLDLDEAMHWWIEKVRAHFASEGPRFHFDPGKSLRANVEDLLKQAQELQAVAGGTSYVGAMLQHLVGAKLDIVLGPGEVKHRGFSVADHSTARNADYEVGTVALHVTTCPTEALVRKCASNLQAGLRPLVVTLGDGVTGAAFLLKGANLQERVDVLDASQFLTANIYERGRFEAAKCKNSLTSLLNRYNDIVLKYERDPSLCIRAVQ